MTRLFAFMVLAAAPAALGSQAPGDLSDAQREMLKAAEADLQSKIAPLAQKIERTARELDRVLLADKPDPDAENKLSGELSDAVSQVVAGAIRFRVDSLRQIVKTLTAEQRKRLIDELDKGGNPDLLELMKKVFPAKK